MHKIPDPLIDITHFPANADQPHGCVIVCPGGGYQGHAPHEAEPIAAWLNRSGLTAFILRYKVTPHKHPAPLNDLAHAVRLVRSRAAQFNIRPDRVAVLGFSAGGHLVTTLATHFDQGRSDAANPLDRLSSRPDAVVACYPVVSLQQFHHQGSLRNLLGDDPSSELITHLSNDQQVTPDTPPTFLWHTADDPVVPVENSLLLAAALSRNKVPFELHIFPQGPHGLGLADTTSTRGHIPQVAQWSQLCEVWLKSLDF